MDLHAFDLKHELRQVIYGLRCVRVADLDELHHAPLLWLEKHLQWPAQARKLVQSHGEGVCWGKGELLPSVSMYLCHSRRGGLHPGSCIKSCLHLPLLLTAALRPCKGTPATL